MSHGRGRYSLTICCSAGIAASPFPFWTCATASSYPAGLSISISATSAGFTWISVLPFVTAYALSRMLQRITPFWVAPPSVVIDPVTAPKTAADARAANAVTTLLRIVFSTPWNPDGY